MKFRGVHFLRGRRRGVRERNRGVEDFDPPLRDAQCVQKTMGVRNDDDDDEIDDGGLFLARSRARASVSPHR